MIFQFGAEHRSWKPSECLFFHLFSIIHTSNYIIWEQGLIVLCQHVPLFSPFSESWCDFLERFVLVRPQTQEAHSTLCFDHIESICLCKDKLLKYWAWLHFHPEPHSYGVKLDFLTFEEILMKINLESFYHGLGYEEGFGPTKFSSSHQRKRFIDTRSFMSMIDHSRRKKIFGEDGVLFVFLCVCLYM